MNLFCWYLRLSYLIFYFDRVPCLGKLNLKVNQWTLWIPISRIWLLRFQPRWEVSFSMWCSFILLPLDLCLFVYQNIYLGKGNILEKQSRRDTFIVICTFTYIKNFMHYSKSLLFKFFDFLYFSISLPKCERKGQPLNCQYLEFPSPVKLKWGTISLSPWE